MSPTLDHPLLLSAAEKVADSSLTQYTLKVTHS